MTGFMTRAAAALCLAAMTFAAPAFAQEAQSDRELKATHGAWKVYCLAGSDTCAMQQVGETADGKRALMITIERLAGVNADGKPVAAALTVHTPLGVLIPYNVRVKIDNGEVHPVQLLRCTPDSCMARAPLNAQDVASFKGGSEAKVGFYLSNEVLVDISLMGFTAAYDSLTPVEMDQPAGN